MGLGIGNTPTSHHSQSMLLMFTLLSLSLSLSLIRNHKFSIFERVRSKLIFSDMRDEFRSVPQDTDAVLGENIVLECSPPKGHPEPLVKWKKNGDNLDLTSAKRIKIDEAGNLVIYSAEKKDQGRYQCTAENIAASKVSKPIRLKVHGKRCYYL